MGDLYDTVPDADCNFQSTLPLSDRAKATAQLSKGEYKGGIGRTRKEAEQSAARELWDDPLVKLKAERLPESCCGACRTLN